MILNIILTLFLVFLNGFFVAAEFAIVKVRLSQIELRIKTGSSIAKTTKHLITHLDSYLSATQLGITLASLGLGWIGESVVAKIIIAFMGLLDLSINELLAHQIALPTAFITITILHIVFGELAPKSIAIQNSEKVALTISLPLRAFYLFFRPFIWILNTFANWIIKLMGFRPASEEEELHSAEELRYLLEESSKSGMIGIQESELIENVFEFTDTPIKQIMVPRGKIVAVGVSMPLESIQEKFISEGYSRMPVYDGTIDNIKGILYAKDLIKLMCNSDNIEIKDIIRPVYFINENEKIDILLRNMQRNKIHLAIVLDEFGGTSGLVTMEDIIEELVGEIQDEYDEETPIITQLSDFEFKIKASASINDINEILPVALPESEEYETLGGLIIGKLGRIPEDKEIINIDNYECNIIECSDRHIETVILKYLEEQNDHDK
jgi:CBS domain containing-hemolysin-like protein